MSTVVAPVVEIPAQFIGLFRSWLQLRRLVEFSKANFAVSPQLDAALMGENHVFELFIFLHALGSDRQSLNAMFFSHNLEVVESGFSQSQIVTGPSDCS